MRCLENYEAVVSDGLCTGTERGYMESGIPQGYVTNEDIEKEIQRAFVRYCRGKLDIDTAKLNYQTARGRLKEILEIGAANATTPYIQKEALKRYLEYRGVVTRDL